MVSQSNFDVRFGDIDGFLLIVVPKFFVPPWRFRRPVTELFDNLADSAGTCRDGYCPIAPHPTGSNRLPTEPPVLDQREPGIPISGRTDNRRRHSRVPAADHDEAYRALWSPGVAVERRVGCDAMVEREQSPTSAVLGASTVASVK